MDKRSNGNKYVYYFGGGKADGNESMKNLLGGKGANLAEMAGHPELRLPVPRDLQLQQKCVLITRMIRKLSIRLKTQIESSLEKMESMGKKFGDEKIHCLFLFVRVQDDLCLV